MSNSTEPAFAAVVLAAGNSSRLGQPKQLLRFQGQILLARALDLAQSALPKHCMLALGANSRQIWQALVDEPLVQNGGSLDLNQVERLDVENWQLGMGASLQKSVSTIIDRAEIGGLLILLVDQYKIAPSFVQRLIDLWRTQPTLACCARYQQLCGAPAILPRNWFADILSGAPADYGARLWLRSRKDVQMLDISDPGDLDQPEDIGSNTPNHVQVDARTTKQA